METQVVPLSEPEVEGQVEVEGKEAKLVELGEVSRETRGGIWGFATEVNFGFYFA